MKQNLQTIEGALYKLKLNINNIGIDEISVYGFCSAYGCSKCVHFEASQGEDNSYLLVVPALNSGLYKYQVFIKNNGTKQEFLVLEGEIIVTDRLCDCNEDIALSPSYSTADVTVSAESIDISMSIEKGMQGDKGDKGDKGDQGFSAYEIAVQHGYKDTEEQWIKDFEGAQEAAQSAKEYMEGAENYYQLSANKTDEAASYAANALQHSNNAAEANTSATQQATNAKKSADDADALLQQTKTEKQAAQTAAINAVQSEQNAKSYSDSALSYANCAQSMSDTASAYKDSALEYYQSSVSQANIATQQATNAKNSATAAKSSADAAATSASKIGNAALKSSTNTFTAVNTFNARIAANGGISGLPTPPNTDGNNYKTTGNYATNWETTRLMDFVTTATMRQITSYLTKKSAATVTENDSEVFKTVAVPKGNEVVFYEGTAQLQMVGNYIKWSAIWIPFYTAVSQVNSNLGKFRFIPGLSTQFVNKNTDTPDPFIKQATDIDKPFSDFRNMRYGFHFGSFEVFCKMVAETTSDNKTTYYSDWTIYAPQFVNNDTSVANDIEQIKVYNFRIQSGGYNYTGESGFMIVASDYNKGKLFYRDFNLGHYRWIYCGELNIKNDMYKGSSNYGQKIHYAATGNKGAFNMYIPKKITFMPNWMGGLYFPNCQEVLRAVTGSNFTETTITIDEYEALQA